MRSEEQESEESRESEESKESTGSRLSSLSSLSPLSSLSSLSSLSASAVGTELLDDPHLDAALARRLLLDIATANFWLGGWAAVRFGLARLLGPADRGTTVTLLDIGAGAGDIPLRAVRWGAGRGVTIVPIALDRIPAAAALAGERGVATVAACAERPPFAARSVDIVVLSQVVHHFDADGAVRLLASAGQLARRGVVVGELRRSRLAALGFRAAGAALGLHHHTVTDGVTSLRRGYLADELAALCRRAGEVAGEGAADVRATARPFSRVVAWWRTDAHH
ncbi:MAG: methyltransferase domain-containing protein [Gemmatimonadales bacterium]